MSSGSLVKVKRTNLLVMVVILAFGVGFGCDEDNLAYKCSLRCHRPQARAMVTTEVLGIHDKTVIPHMIVLHRCDAFSGCCNIGSNCSVLSAVEVNITVYLKENWKYKPHTYTASNHTECCCRSALKNDIIK